METNLRGLTDDVICKFGRNRGRRRAQEAIESMNSKTFGNLWSRLDSLVLGVLRTLAIVYSPMERRLVERLKPERSNSSERHPQVSDARVRNMPRFPPPVREFIREINNASTEEYGRRTS
jgi:hypothetical protein